MGIRNDIENCYLDTYNQYPNDIEWDFEEDLISKLNTKDIYEINKQMAQYNSKCGKIKSRKATPEELARAERAAKRSKERRDNRKFNWEDLSEE